MMVGVALRLPVKISGNHIHGGEFTPYVPSATFYFKSRPGITCISQSGPRGFMGEWRGKISRDKDGLKAGQT